MVLSCLTVHFKKYYLDLAIFHQSYSRAQAIAYSIFFLGLIEVFYHFFMRHHDI